MKEYYAQKIILSAGFDESADLISRNKRGEDPSDLFVSMIFQEELAGSPRNFIGKRVTYLEGHNGKFIQPVHLNV